jgi:hypothetical protein
MKWPDFGVCLTVNCIRKNVIGFSTSLFFALLADAGKLGRTTLSMDLLAWNP